MSSFLTLWYDGFLTFLNFVVSLLIVLQLWKHRWVEVDDQGNLVLRPIGGNEVSDFDTAQMQVTRDFFWLTPSNQRTNNILKRFHMTEFNPPFAPDLERQEMPNSKPS